MATSNAFSLSFTNSSIIIKLSQYLIMISFTFSTNQQPLSILKSSVFLRRISLMLSLLRITPLSLSLNPLKLSHLSWKTRRRPKCYSGSIKIMRVLNSSLSLFRTSIKMFLLTKSTLFNKILISFFSFFLLIRKRLIYLLKSFNLICICNCLLTISRNRKPLKI